MRIPEEVRDRLKKPLGTVHQDYGAIKRMAGSHRIISVGDVCTLGLLGVGVMPHLAVFDFRYMRKPLKPAHISIIRSSFGRIRRMRNKAGTLSDKIMESARKLLRDGGAVLIDGEEDLTALAFIANAGPGHIIIYGQPGEGVVLVKPDKKTKKKVRALLSAAASLGHKVKRSEHG